MISNVAYKSMNIRTISLAGFEVSWAGGNPGSPGDWYGSDDGRVQFIGRAGARTIGPYAIAPSQEAVNGIAFAGGLMAVSTRSDVTFFKVSELGTNSIPRTIFHGGAHGVLGIQGGRIIAPMGQRGILLVQPNSETARRASILKAADEEFYVYKVVSLGSPDRGEILFYAGRRGGCATVPLADGVPGNHGKKLRPDGFDFVDVAALDVDGFPFALAALGLDCSIHLVSDVLADQARTALHLWPPGERAYRILCAEGHVFLLTDKHLYAFVNLASRFLHGEPTWPLEARSVGLEAIDVGLASDRSLLVVMAETVYGIAIDSIIGHGKRPRSLGALPGSPMHEADWKTCQGSAWVLAKELELAEFG